MATLKQELRGSYEGVIEQWKVDLALSRIQGLGFPECEWPALLQVLVLDMREFTYDPGRSEGAKESTVIYRIISHRLVDEIRRRARQKKYATSLDEYLEAAGGEPQDSPRLRDRDTTARRIDIRDAVAALPPVDRDICEGLLRRENTHQVAKRLGMGWHTVRRRIGRIRWIFEGMGLGSWIGM